MHFMVHDQLIAYCDVFFRRPIIDDYFDCCPSAEQWNGYVNNDDRVLLKVYDSLN